MILLKTYIAEKYLMKTISIRNFYLSFWHIDYMFFLVTNWKPRYEIHPIFEKVNSKPGCLFKIFVPICCETADMEVMLLGFAAENFLNYSVVPKIILMLKALLQIIGRTSPFYVRNLLSPPEICKTLGHIWLWRNLWKNVTWKEHLKLLGHLYGIIWAITLSHHFVYSQL